MPQPQAGQLRPADHRIACNLHIRLSGILPFSGTVALSAEPPQPQQNLKRYMAQFEASITHILFCQTH